MKNKITVIEKLRKDYSITPEFEMMFNMLTLEDLLALKLELTARSLNHRFYGFKLYQSIKDIVQEAFCSYAFIHSKTYIEAATVLGISAIEFQKKVLKFNLKEKYSK